MRVAFSPNDPKNIAIATSFTKGDVIRKAKVTPSGMPPFTNPMKSGIDEQLQNGVIAPKRAAKKYWNPYNLRVVKKVLSLSIGK